MIVHGHLVEFEGINTATKVYANLELKKVYEQGPLNVSLVGSLVEEKEGLNSSYDAKDFAIDVHSGDSSVDAEVSQDVPHSLNT
ncbi:hypothetical protein SLA2020_030850 [Shorea laevis]